MHTLKVPPRFWDDHYERCADHDGSRNEVRRTTKYVEVELDDDALTDLGSDAEYYANPYGPDVEDVYGAALKRSAKATWERVKPLYKALHPDTRLR